MTVIDSIKMNRTSPNDLLPLLLGKLQKIINLQPTQGNPKIKKIIQLSSSGSEVSRRRSVNMPGEGVVKKVELADEKNKKNGSIFN